MENNKRGDRDSIRVVWNCGARAYKLPDCEDESVVRCGGADVSNLSAIIVVFFGQLLGQRWDSVGAG